MSRKRWFVAVLVAIGALFLFSPCITKVRDGEGWVRSAVSIRRIGAALRQYHDVTGRLPPAVVCDKDGRPLYSWRVALLPFLEEVTLYPQFHLDEPWDSPNNLPLTITTPRCYLPALGGNHDEPGLTRYQVLIGPGSAFKRPGLTFDDFPDGLETTFLVIEAAEPVPWAKPVDLEYHPDLPLPKLGGEFTKPVHFLCSEVGRKPGFVACFGDGKSRFIWATTDEKIVRAMITRDGGEDVDVAGFN